MSTRDGAVAAVAAVAPLAAHVCAAAVALGRTALDGAKRDDRVVAQSIVENGSSSNKMIVAK